MRPLLLARSLTRANLKRYASTLVVAAVSLGLLVFGMVALAWQSTTTATRSDGLSSPALRTISVQSFGSSQDPLPVTVAAITEIASRQGVEAATVFEVVQVAPVAPAGSDVFDTVVLGVAPRFPAVQPPLVQGDEPTSPNDVVMPADLARLAGIEVGATMQVEHIVIDESGERVGSMMDTVVVGLYDDTVHGLDDDLTMYASLDTVVGILADETGQTAEWVNDRRTFSSAFVTVETLSDVDPMVAALRDEGYGATSVSTLVTGASPTLRFLKALAPVIALIAAGMAMSLAWSIASSIAEARRSEVGMLRALGWRRGEMRLAFSAQLGALGMAAGVLASGSFALVAGILAGIHHVVGGSALDWAPEPSLQWLVVTVALPVLAAIVFAVAPLPVIARLARVPVDSVLRDSSA